MRRIFFQGLGPSQETQGKMRKKGKEEREGFRKPTACHKSHKKETVSADVRRPLLAQKKGSGWYGSDAEGKRVWQVNITFPTP